MKIGVFLKWVKSPYERVAEVDKSKHRKIYSNGTLLDFISVMDMSLN